MIFLVEFNEKVRNFVYRFEIDFGFVFGIKMLLV